MDEALCSNRLMIACTLVALFCLLPCSTGWLALRCCLLQLPASRTCRGHPLDTFPASANQPEHTVVPEAGYGIHDTAPAVQAIKEWKTDTSYPLACPLEGRGASRPCLLLHDAMPTGSSRIFAHHVKGHLPELDVRFQDVGALALHQPMASTGWRRALTTSGRGS